MIAQDLLERYHEIPVACCKDILENVPADDVLITNDKAHFHLTGFVNRQNFRCWLGRNSRAGLRK